MTAKIIGEIKVSKATNVTYCLRCLETSPEKNEKYCKKCQEEIKQEIEAAYKAK